MPRTKRVYGPKPLDKQPKYIRTREAERAARQANDRQLSLVLHKHAGAMTPARPVYDAEFVDDGPARATHEFIDDSPRPSRSAPVQSHDFVPKPYGGEFAWASGHRGRRGQPRPKRERASPMSFADVQAATFGPVPFQQQPRKVRRAYDYGYRRKQARWAKARPSDSAGSSSSWGGQDERRALKSYRGARWDDGESYGRSRRRSRRRRTGGNARWSAAAWSGRSGGRSRRPKLSRRSNYRAAPRRTSRRSMRGYAAPRLTRWVCRSKKRRFSTALARARAPFSRRQWSRMPTARRRKRTGSALSQVSRYCSNLLRGRRPARGGKRRGRRTRRARRY